MDALKTVFIVMLWRAQSFPQIVGVYSEAEYAHKRIGATEDINDYHNMFVVEREINPDFGPYGPEQRKETEDVS